MKKSVFLSFLTCVLLLSAPGFALPVEDTGSILPLSGGDRVSALRKSYPPFTVGDLKLSLNSIQPSGWMIANGINTIGNADSGATYAGDDYQEIYTVLYTQYPTWSVSGGRGGSAALDFSDGKLLTLDNLGARFLLSSGQGATTETGALGTEHSPGETGGAETHTLTVEELAAHTHSYTKVKVSKIAGDGTQGGPNGNEERTSAPSGGNMPHNNMPPYFTVHAFVWSGVGD